MSDDSRFNLTEKGLAAFAKKCREQGGKTRAQAARDMNVAQTSIFNAEEKAAHGLRKLRVRMIERYSRYNVKGPVFILTLR